MSIQTLIRNHQGYRVKTMEEDEIVRMAQRVGRTLGFTKRKRHKIGHSIEKLGEFITWDICTKEDWEELTGNLTLAHYDPSELTVRMPDETYEKAVNGDKEALGILFHELGHIFLAHSQKLHKGNAPMTQKEDAEWQADRFADALLEYMGFNPYQLSLDLI